MIDEIHHDKIPEETPQACKDFICVIFTTVHVQKVAMHCSTSCKNLPTVIRVFMNVHEKLHT